jgi:hypothetical protein
VWLCCCLQDQTALRVTLDVIGLVSWQQQQQQDCKQLQQECKQQQQSASSSSKVQAAAATATVATTPSTDCKKQLSAIRQRP